MGNLRNELRKCLSRYLAFLIIYSFSSNFFPSVMKYGKYYLSLHWASTNESLPGIRRVGRKWVAVTLDVTLDVSLKTLHPEEQSNEEMPFSISSVVCLMMTYHCKYIYFCQMIYKVLFTFSLRSKLWLWAQRTSTFMVTPGTESHL